MTGFHYDKLQTLLGLHFTLQLTLSRRKPLTAYCYQRKCRYIISPFIIPPLQPPRDLSAASLDPKDLLKLLHGPDSLTESSHCPVVLPTQLRHSIDHQPLLRCLGDLIVPVVVAFMAWLVVIAVCRASRHMNITSANAGHWDQLSSCSISLLPVDT